MEGWKLREGKITKTNLSEQSIWLYFNIIFSTKSKNQSSFKFGFIRSLLDNLYNVDADLCLHIDKIFFSFTRIYWHLIIKYGLSQTDRSHKQSVVERILLEFKNSYNISSDIPFDSLADELKLKIVESVTKKAKQYVIGAVYGDSEGSFYDFSIKKGFIRFNKDLYAFLQKYQQIILRLNNYEWAKFLEKNNPIPKDFIVSIEQISKRNNLSQFRRILEEYTERKCFYCNRNLKNNLTIHVDHFIPWSYIHNDNLWNLVLACSRCNISKNVKLPSNIYLEKLLIRNIKLSKIEKSVVVKEFENYSPNKINDLYYYASLNGFQSNWVTPYYLGG